MKYRIVKGLSSISALQGYRIERKFPLIGWIQVDWFPTLGWANRRLDQMLGRVAAGDVVREEAG